jgi:glycosyltransferase involved in cell wall biosynthesis
MTQNYKKVAIIHDWLPLIAGAERVLEQLVAIFPDADIYTLFDFLTDDQKKIFGNCKITSSYLNKLPKVQKYYRKLLPLCPQAIEDFDLSGYDLIISSSHAVAKGVITGADQVHISYVHSPARYAWDLMHQYLKQSNLEKGLKGYLAKYLLSKFRIWDYRTANGVDQFIANSNYIARRVRKTYRREAEVIYPPVNVEQFSLVEKKEDFYLTASRMVPYKRLDLIAEAFAKMPDKKLVIIGDGPEMHKVKAAALHTNNIQILGYQETTVLRDHMQRAKAFVFAAEEDFGIIAVEAQACGTPVIAYGVGGALETVIDYDTNPEKATGVHFKEQTAPAIIAAVTRFEQVQDNILPAQCHNHAENFSIAKFKEKIIAITEATLQRVHTC